MSNNTKYGSDALKNNNGNNNTAIGSYAMYNNLNAYNNTAIGSNTSFYTTTGNNNTSIGSGSLCNNTIGSLNTAVGSSALEGIEQESVGDQNTAIGVQSLYENTGTQNTAIGAYSGLNTITGSYNTLVGANSQLSAPSYDYSTAIGYNAQITSSNQIVLGGLSELGYPDSVVNGQLYLPNYSNVNDSTQVVPKSYVDIIASGLHPTKACICATTQNITPFPPTVLPLSSVTDGVDLSALDDGSYNILVVCQNGTTNELTSNISNGIWVVGIVSGSLASWSRPIAPEPMSVGYNAVGVFTFIHDGLIYGKTALVEIYKNTTTNSAVVGTDTLEFNIFYQLNISAGQGLYTQVTDNNMYLNVNPNLNFLTYLDASNSGTLNVGTNSNTVILGKSSGTMTVNGILSVVKNMTVGGISIGTGNNSSTSRTAVGYLALSNTSDTGTNNTAIGSQTMMSNTTGQFNSTIGNATLRYNTTGYHNTAIGNGTMQNNTTGYCNTSIGSGAHNLNTDGCFNTAVGFNSLKNDVDGSYNTSIGVYSQYTSTGSYNTSMGYESMYKTTSGEYNTCVGYKSLYNNTTGMLNTTIGYNAGLNLLTGSNVTCIGNNAQPSSGSVGNEITLGDSNVTTLRCQATLTSLSDARDKTNIVSLNSGDGSKFISQLNPVNFIWEMRDGGKTNVPSQGFIAQELQNVQEQTGITVPGLVYDANPDRLEASYITLLPIMVQAIKDLQNEVNELKKK